MDSGRYAGGVGREVEEHVRICAECRAYRERSGALDALLAVDTGGEVAGPGFDARFYARLEELKHTPPRMGHAWRWLLGGLALSGAGLGIVLMLSTPRPGSEDVSLVMELELLEDLELLREMDNVEAYAALAQLEVPDLDALLDELGGEP